MSYVYIAIGFLMAYLLGLAVQGSDILPIVIDMHPYKKEFELYKRAYEELCKKHTELLDKYEYLCRETKRGERK